MRKLTINNTIVDIDERTALGITFKAYDVSDVGKAFTNDSNTFSVPITSKNLTLFGNIQNAQSISTKIYEENLCNYWVNGGQHLTDAKISVKSITNRINLYAVNKNSFWDISKKTNWNDFTYDLVQWLHSEKFLPAPTAPYFGSFVNFIQDTGVVDNTEGILLPMYITNNEMDNEAPYTAISLNDYEVSTGGHFCIYVKTIFEYLESAYDINFGTQEVGLNGNIWDDAVASSLYIPLRELLVISSYDSVHYFKQPSKVDWNTEFSPYDIEHANEDKTLHDFISSFFKHMNVLKDEIQFENRAVTRLSRFDDLETKAEVVDYTSRFDKIKSFKPLVKGYAQENYIKFSSIYENGSEFLNSKTLTCLNQNIEVNKTIVEIDAYVGNVRESTTSDTLIDLSTEDSFKTFEFLISSGETSDDIAIETQENVASSPAIFQPFVNVGFEDFNSGAKGDSVFGLGIDNSAICHHRLYNVGASSFIRLSWTPVNGGNSFSVKINDGVVLLKTVPLSAGFLEYQFTSGEGALPILLTIQKDSTSADYETMDVREMTGTIYERNPFNGYSSTLKKAAFYDLSSEYNFLNNALSYPKFYEVQRWMTNEDIRKLEFFKLYYFKQLGGSFFLNKVSGFNPEKSKKSTTLELFRVSDKTPLPVYDREYFIDESGNYFIDESGNKYY